MYLVFPLCISSPIFLLFLFSLLSSSISVILFVVNATSFANRRLVRVSPSMLSPLSRSTV